MSDHIKLEFTDNLNHKRQYEHGCIEPITSKEFYEAIHLVKHNKATASDCISDHIIKELASHPKDKRSELHNEFGENMISLINHCFTRKQIPT